MAGSALNSFMNLIDNFKPPIKSRTTRELIEIAACPEKWNEVAFLLAQKEVELREINPNEIKRKRRSVKQSERNEKYKIANEPFCFFSFELFEGFINWEEVFTFLFSPETVSVFPEVGSVHQGIWQPERRQWRGGPPSS